MLKQMKRKRSNAREIRTRDKKIPIFKIQFYDHHFSDHIIPSNAPFPHTNTKNREGYRDTRMEEDETNHAMASVSSER